MKLLATLFVFVATVQMALSQFKPFPTDQVTYKELNMKVWPLDSSANAVVLNELGESRIVIDDNVLWFEYYVKIKIFNKNALNLGNFEIDLYKSDQGSAEVLRDVVAKTYSLNGNRIESQTMDPKAIYVEKNKYVNTSKFALPNVTAGCVIEVRYRIESPFFRTFRKWEFQSDIPKAKSEYQAMIPGNFQYAISLRGAQQLSKRSDSQLIKECFKLGTSSADCAFNTYLMDSIPAFKTEQFMTAKRNFLSALYFELLDVTDFHGIVHKHTREWKDVDDELRRHEDFGKQIKKVPETMLAEISARVAAETDPLKKATIVYDYIKSHFSWNGHATMFADVGVKKAYELKKGNAAEINLSMVGALQEVGLTADPVILSTRSNGLVNNLYPVLTEFNYVIASVLIGEKRYLLDGTNVYRPFGVLPIRCVNGEGRLIAKQSSWVPLLYAEKTKRVEILTLTLSKDQNFEGKLTVSNSGYDGIEKRYVIDSIDNPDDYLKYLKHKMGLSDISGYEKKNVDELDKPLVETMNVSIPFLNESAETIYFDPFSFVKLTKNPFTSQTRTFPVDYGNPSEEFFQLMITIPEGYKVDELPKNTALVLPNGGGRFLSSATQIGGKINIVSNLVLLKAVYNYAEYHYLREMYAQMMQLYQSQIVFKKL